MQLSPIPATTRPPYPKFQTGGLEASSDSIWVIPSRTNRIVQVPEAHYSMAHHHYHQDADLVASAPTQTILYSNAYVSNYPCGGCHQTTSQHLMEIDNEPVMDPGVSPRDISFLNQSHYATGNHLPLGLYYQCPSVPYPAYYPRNRQPQFAHVNTPSSLHSTNECCWFNPRTAVKMSHSEKVRNWIDQVPVFPVEDGFWGHSCYAYDYQSDCEEIEFDDVKCDSISLENYDEILFLQSRKIDCLVRKLYCGERDISSSVE